MIPELVAVDDQPDDLAERGSSRRGRHGLAISLARSFVAKLVQAAVFLLLLVTALFFLIRASADPAATIAGPDADPEQLAAVKRLYGFDRPLVLQYLAFLKRFVSLDFGKSVQTGEDALQVALAHVGQTLELLVAATLVNVVVSAALGIWLASRKGTRRALAVDYFLVFCQGVQFYIVGLLLVVVFAIHWRVFPATGSATWSALVLPTISLAWLVIPRLTRVVADAASEVLQSEYVRAARAFGLRPRTILGRTVLTNVLIPLIATATTQFTLLISGAVIIEKLFGIDGLGSELVRAVQDSNFPVVAAAVSIIGVIVFAVTLLTDFLYQLADPRLRRESYE